MTPLDTPAFLDHYSSATGELFGTSVLERYDDGTPKLVSFATPRRAPAFEAGQMAVFLDAAGLPPVLEADGSWIVVSDARGTTYWLPDGTETLIKDLGVLVPADGLLVKPAPIYSSEQRAKIAGHAVGNMLDVLAEAWQYSSYISARTYVGDPSPKFDAEARALVAYGSACYTRLDEIAAGQRPEPADVNGLLAMMPTPPERPVV